SKRCGALPYASNPQRTALPSWQIGLDAVKPVVGEGGGPPAAFAAHRAAERRWGEVVELRQTAGARLLSERGRLTHVPSSRWRTQREERVDEEAAGRVTPQLRDTRGGSPEVRSTCIARAAGFASCPEPGGHRGE
ncbi:MAG TPA: hypothetical protein VED59_03125, partial [Acidimicrobiales bacterium]|nr:hypothetical protein [Acidimicrobiales bacterium]